MNEATLTAAEFGFLLSTLDVQAVVGVEQDVVAPADRDTVFQRGLDELKQHGWLVPGAESGRENLSIELMLMIECVGVPRFSLRAERGDADGYQSVAYYLTDKQIVELVETSDGGYQFSNIAAVPVVIGRVLESLQWPEASADDPTGVTLTQEDFAEVAAAEKSGERDTAAGKLTELGLSQDAAVEFLETYAQADFKGTVEVNRHAGSAIAEAFFLAMFVRNDTCWALSQSVDNAASLMLAPAGAKQGGDHIRDYLAHFVRQSNQSG